MNEQHNPISDPYRVRSGDTLSGIARRSGKRQADLIQWNGLRDANHLTEGQVLYLSPASAYGFQALFLDALHHPIQNLPYQLQFDGKTATGKTGPTGLTPKYASSSALSEIRILVQNIEHQWQQIAATVSGVGNKLITLISGQIVVKGQTEELPPKAPPAPSEPSHPEQARSTAQQHDQPVQASGTSTENNPAVKTKKDKGPHGQSIIQIAIELPQGLLDHFKKYSEGEISADDWKKIANELGCEVAVLKAVAEVESGGNNSFWRLNSGDGAHIPAILYERHYFSRITARQYDTNHPDVSWRSGYKVKSQLGKNNNAMPFGIVKADDLYGNFTSAYLRLIKAYGLDKSAALRSCSWGKFQIMGDNYTLCGMKDIFSFVDAMCTSELQQVRLLANYIKNKPRAWIDPRNKTLGKEISLWDSLKIKNWQAMAFNYNGPAYKTFNYDAKLEEAYEKYK